MAIAYKSQGAGASTETSGAALSPLCPATVDAGDILIAHVFWEGTTTAPSTPSGWTLLSGPHVIQSTIARHWVFGKIADGTEDGAAVAFGAPAVTTQRGARVYSFSGRAAGTITELVTGFAATSHATDPQMPTVATTETGNLAVSLVGQNDNNAFASPTGESGGDWVEAVAEYTVALTPGMSLGIETCTPTSNPGTVSGGSMATTNDPCGVIGFQIKQSAPQLVTPTTLAIVTATFAPTVSVPRLVTPTTLALVTSTFAPTVIISQIVTPTTLALVTSTFAPTVTATQNVHVTPTTLALVTSTFAPTVSAPRLVTPTTLAQVLATFAPTVTATANVLCTPTTAGLVLATFAPAVVTPRLVTPGIVALTLTTFAPTISAPRVATPTTTALVLATFEPTVTVGGGGNPVLVTPETVALLFTTYAPTVTTTEDEEIVAPPAATVVFGGGGYYEQYAKSGHCGTIPEMLKKNKQRKARRDKTLAKVLAMLDALDEI